MEQFKKDLITTGRPSFIPALILGIIAIISAVTGIAFEFSRYDNFDPTHKGLAQLNAIYLMGPFAEETTNGKVTARYYIAEDTNGYLCVISTNKNTSVPVYGQDFTDGNDIYSFTPQTLKGNRVKISAKLASYLVKYFKTQVLVLLLLTTLITLEAIILILITTGTSSLLYFIYVPAYWHLQLLCYSYQETVMVHLSSRKWHSLKPMVLSTPYMRTLLLINIFSLIS